MVATFSLNNKLFISYVEGKPKDGGKYISFLRNIELIC